MRDMRLQVSTTPKTPNKQNEGKIRASSRNTIRPMNPDSNVKCNTLCPTSPGHKGEQGPKIKNKIEMPKTRRHLNIHSERDLHDLTTRVNARTTGAMTDA